MLSIVLLLLSSWSTLAAGHFNLNYPVSLGFNDDKESEGPCGGFQVDFTGNVTNITVGNFPISLRSGHPQADWLFRVTLSKADPFNWTNLLPVVDETGLGFFCLENVMAPAEFAGKQGLVQVIQNAADGALYQVGSADWTTPTQLTCLVRCREFCAWLEFLRWPRLLQCDRAHCVHN